MNNSDGHKAVQHLSATQLDQVLRHMASVDVDNARFTDDPFIHFFWYYDPRAKAGHNWKKVEIGYLYDNILEFIIAQGGAGGPETDPVFEASIDTGNGLPTNSALYVPSTSAIREDLYDGIAYTVADAQLAISTDDLIIGAKYVITGLMGGAENVFITHAVSVNEFAKSGTGYFRNSVMPYVVFCNRMDYDAEIDFISHIHEGKWNNTITQLPLYGSTLDKFLFGIDDGSNFPYMRNCTIHNLQGVFATRVIMFDVYCHDGATLNTSSTGGSTSDCALFNTDLYSGAVLNMVSNTTVFTFFSLSDTLCGSAFGLISPGRSAIHSGTTNIVVANLGGSIRFNDTYPLDTTLLPGLQTYGVYDMILGISTFNLSDGQIADLKIDPSGEIDATTVPWAGGIVLTDTSSSANIVSIRGLNPYLNEVRIYGYQTTPMGDITVIDMTDNIRLKGATVILAEGHFDMLVVSAHPANPSSVVREVRSTLTLSAP